MVAEEGGGQPEPGYGGANIGAIIFQSGAGFETLTQLAQAAPLKRGGKRMGSRAVELITSIAQRIEEEGREAGFAEGHAAGLVEGLAESLFRVLQRRFGPLSPVVQARIAAASAEELGGWIGRALDAPSLEALFGDALWR